MADVLDKLGMRELRLLLGGAVVIVVTLLVFSLLVPRAKALVAAYDAVDVLRAASEDGEALEQRLAAWNERIEALEYRLYGDMASLPVRQVEAYIIGRLQEISWSADVDLVGVEPALGRELQIYQELLFNVELVGGYEDLYRWLWDVRNELGYVVVQDYSLTRRDDTDDDPALTARLSLASYRAVR